MFKDKQVNSLAGGADVTQYMKVTRVSSWVVLVAAFVAILCIAAWLSIGTIKTTVPITGINDDGKMTFFISPAKAVSIRNCKKIEYKGQTVGVPTGYEQMNLTESQARARIDNEYYAQQFTFTEMNVVIFADVDPLVCPNGVITVDCVLAEMAPFELFTS